MSAVSMNPASTPPYDGLHGIACPKCQRSNGLDRRFCGACGESLWQNCGACGHENPLSETFCGRCGVNLAAKLRELCDLAAAALREADQLAADGAYFDAAAVLKRIPESTHPQLKAWREKAQFRIQELMAERSAAVKRESELLPRVQELVREAHFSSAKELIDQLPRGIRSPELQALAATVDACLAEIQELSRRVRDALKSKQLSSASEQIDRLARLKPHDPTVQKLKAQLDAQRQSADKKSALQWARQAKLMLDQNQYLRAAELVARIPDESRQDSIESLSLQVDELGWLFDQLRLAPAATGPLQRMALRMQKLRPQDPQWGPIVEKVAKVLQSRLRDPRWSRPWVALPESTALGRPVQWWTSLGTDQVSETQRPLWDEHPGAFFVATGLALQGLGQSRFPLHLPRPDASRSVWSAWAQTQSKARTAPTVWGLDLGRRSLKAVCMSWNKKTQQISIDDAYRADHVSPPGANSGPDELRDAQRQLIEDWLKAKNLKSPKVVLGMAGSRVLGRFFAVPGTDLKKIRGAMQFESKAQVPIPADAVSIDFHLESSADDSTRQTQVMLVAARNEHVKHTLENLPDHRCDVLAVQPDSVALFNAAARFLMNDPAWLPAGAACALLDVGYHSTNIVIGSNQIVWFRNVPFGSERLYESVARQFRLTRAQAETVCHQMSGIKFTHQLDRLLSGSFHEFTGEIRRTLEIFEQEHQQPVGRVVGSGGGFAQHGLFRYLVHGK